MNTSQRSLGDGDTAARTWLALLGILLGLFGLTWWAQQPPRPQGMDASPLEFSEARAMVVVRKLADEIGPHPIGSPAGAAAAEFLATELRKLPRVEVEVQDVEGDNRLGIWTGVNFHYRVRNVVARLAGRRTDAVLVNAHYDSPAEAPGATDNGLGTAAALETMHALAHAPQLEWTVVLNLNGGEEAGSVGSAGFLQHRFAKDVRVFLDTDGSGSGKAALVQASGQVRALISAYAKVAPMPQASVLHNDLAQSGLLGQSGDFEPLTRFGIPGLDVAALGDIWAVHTHLDVSSRLGPGTLQHLGTTLLAVTRELASHPPQLEAKTESAVYYDLLGQKLVVYSMTTARGLGVGALALLGFAIFRLLRKGELTGRQLVRSTGWTLLSALAGLLSALLVAVILTQILQRPHGWFAMPLLSAPCFIGAGIGGVLAVLGLWRRRALATGMSAESVFQAAWASGLLCWGGLLLLATARSLGVGYLALWWVVPSSLAILVGQSVPRARLGLWLASVVLGMTGLVQLVVHMVPALAGLSGMFPVPPPGDVKLAMVYGMLVVVPLALCGLAGLHRVGQLRRALGVWLAVAGLGVISTALHFPYSAARPKRLLATHAQRDGQAALLLMSLDVLPLLPHQAGISEAQSVPASEDWPNALLPPGWLPPYSHKLPASPLDAAPPRLEVLSRSEDAKTGTRTVTMRLLASGWMTAIDIPQESLAGWSLGEPLPQPGDGQPMISAVFYAPNPVGQEVTLRLRGTTPVTVTLRQNHAPAQTRELIELRRRLPDWTTINAAALQVVRTTL